MTEPLTTPRTSAPDRVTIDVHLDPAGEEEALAALRSALEESPRRIPSRFFYDDRGSKLFERITELPEYYPTRTEAALLRESANDIVAASGAEELVELGSGAATKTRILLDAMDRAGQLLLYVPMDVAETFVRRSAEELADEYPELQVHGVVGDFLLHLEEIPEGGRRLVIFLGGTIGNLTPGQAREFLTAVRGEMSPRDCLLLGTDRIKETARLEAAYNDSQGVTAEFNLNILRVVNRLADGDFDPAGFRHRAFYDPDRYRIEMRLVATGPQTVHLPRIGLSFELAEGEELHTEISTKYDRRRAEELLTDSGFETLRWYTDAEDLFALTLARKNGN
jgi:L-histidine N-alpha-methyltransferase